MLLFRACVPTSWTLYPTVESQFLKGIDKGLSLNGEAFLG